MTTRLIENSSKMPTPNQENFKYYKKAESKALEILTEMKAATPKKMDIEIVLGHLETVEPYYVSQAP
jgi:hypothetical protein